MEVRKFQRVSSNGSSTTTDTSLNPHKIASHKPNLELQNHVDDGGHGGGGGGIDVVLGGGGGGVGRLCGWPSSRIVRVSRASGGKDRHSKVLTSKGLRDRRVRLSVSTAIQFYDLQDRLGYDQPSKAVEWLLKAASTSIDELPSLDPSFSAVMSNHHQKKSTGNSTDLEEQNYHSCNNTNTNNNICETKSPAGSSTSETSKGSGLSLSRSENRIKARERARVMASKKEKEKGSSDSASARVSVLNQVNNLSENSSFTDLLTGGINTTTTVRSSSPDTRIQTQTHWTSPMDYFFTRPSQPSTQLIQIPQYNITGDNHQHQHQQPHFSFLQDSFSPAVTVTGGGGGNGGGESYNLNFSMTSSSPPGGAALAPGYSRGTLQSNLPSNIFPHHQHLHDGSTSTNLPFFIVPNAASDHFPATGSYHLSYGGGGDGGGRHSDHHKEKTKN